MSDCNIKIKTEQDEIINPETNSKTICVVQITRIGDVLQTLQVAREFKKEHKHVRLILVARAEFARPLGFLLKETFDKCLFLDLDHIIKNSDQNLNSIQKNMAKFVQTINDENIAVTVNLSFSKSSAWFCSLIKSTHKLGPYYDIRSNINIPDKWSQFVYSNVMGGPLNPFSLVDIYKNILGVTPKTEHPPTKKHSEKYKKLVIHPFTSHIKKRWKISKWVEIIYTTLKNNFDLDITIVGTESERAEAETIVNDPILAKFLNRIKNMAGKTSVKELYQEIKQSSLFVGHDSMAGHLAAICEIPSITISLGPVRPVETAPYHQGNYIFSPRLECFPCFPKEKCDFHQCHSDIPHQVVCSSIQQLIDHNEVTKEYLEKKNSHFHLNSTNIQQTTFSQSGILKLKNILEQHPSTDEIFRKFYRISWSYLLNETDEADSFSRLTAATHKELLRYMAGLTHLFDLASFGKKYSQYILEEISSSTPDIGKIKEFSTRIDEIDELQRTVKKGYPNLSPLIDFFATAKGNLSGTNIVQLTESSFLTYDNCANMTSVLYDLIEKTIAEYKLNSKLGQNNTAGTSL